MISEFRKPDHASLTKTARFESGRCPEEPEDLLQEALLKAVAGERRCPRGVDVVVFVKNTIRSLADNARKRHQRQGRLLDELKATAVVAEEDPQPTRELVRRAHDLFLNDPLAARVIRGKSQGLRGKALRDFARIDGRELGTVQRRIRRRLERAGLEGLP